MATILVHIYHALGIRQQLHTPYHPESSGQAERMNRTITEKLVKVCKQIGLKWPEALNLVLWDIRNSPRQPVGVSPAKILFGRILAVPGTYVPAKTSLLDGDEQITQYLLHLQNSFSWVRNHAYWYQGISPEIQVFFVVIIVVCLFVIFQCILTCLMSIIKKCQKEIWKYSN